MLVFPTHRFCFVGHEADIERRTLSGGTSISGGEDVIATDGGGFVFCEFREAYLDDPEIALEWRGIGAAGDDGATPMIVFLGDVRHQLVGNVFAPDQAAEQEESYPDTTDNVVISTAAALRATSLSLTIKSLPTPPRAGMWLSIDHPALRWRAYRIASVEHFGGGAAVSIRPPLREAVAAGTRVEWANPRCVMRQDGGMRSPTSWGYAEGSVRFVEHFPGPEGYE